MADVTSPFLANPRNQAFLRGTSPHIRGGFGYLWMIVLGLSVFYVILGMVVIGFGIDLELRGVRTTGTILSIEEQDDARRRQSGYRIVYQYTFLGEQHTDETITPFAWVQTLVANMPVDIIYHPNDPSVSKLAQDNSWLMSSITMTIFSLGIGGLGFVLRRRAKYYQMLARDGVILSGVVLDAGKKLKPNGFLSTRDYWLQYQFTTPSGETQTITYNASDGREPPMQGTSVAVLYVNDHQFRLL